MYFQISFDTDLKIVCSVSVSWYKYVFVELSKKKLDCLKTLLTGSQLEGKKGAKAAFQILMKCCVFIAVLSNEKRNFKTPSELIVSCVKSREFYSAT